jgi:hypothetical protein
MPVQCDYIVLFPVMYDSATVQKGAYMAAYLVFME